MFPFLDSGVSLLKVSIPPLLVNTPLVGVPLLPVILLQISVPQLQWLATAELPITSSLNPTQIMSEMV